MTEKEQTISKIVKYSTNYAKMWDFMEGENWNTEKLKFTDLSLLKRYLGDMEIIERNKKQLNG